MRSSLFTGLLLLSACCLAAADLTPRIRELSRQVEDSVIRQRREFAQQPELSNREQNTAHAIEQKLRALGFDEIRTGVARHGIVALLKGGRPGPVVAWRADMDGLPIQDVLNKSYKSKRVGVKHACGHDGHMAIALGVAEVLSKVKADLPGTVKFLFQPAEEGPPAGEPGGAQLMVEEKALENPAPAAIFGLHVWAGVPAGQIGYAVGPLMASADSFELTVKGKRIHASTPHLGVDSVVVAAECVSALQTIRSRRIDPLEPMVLTIGSIHGGNRHNIIADEVRMEGTLRTLNEETRESVRSMVRKTMEGCTAPHGATFEVHWNEHSYPVTANPESLVKESLAPLETAAGKQNVTPIRPIMGAEDFSEFQRVVPGFFWFLGIRNPEKGITAGHHTADFDLDESVLRLGVEAAALQLADFLERHAGR